METKPTIFFVIDDLGIGGAESIFIGTLPHFRQKFSIVLITLNNKCEYNEQIVVYDHRYCLQVSNNKFSIIKGIFKLRSLVKTHSPILIHSHLFYSSLLCKLACINTVPLVFSIHSQLTKYVFSKNLILTFLERAFVNKTQTLIAVSKAVMEDYETSINFKGKKFVLENYIDDSFYSVCMPHHSYHAGTPLRIVALGNIKKVKNYEYLLKSFLYLKDLPVTLDIYGKMDNLLFSDLQSFAIDNGIPVEFKGVAKDIPAIFSGYDLYVMSSIHEGFGIAAVEAMACGLPALLSDLQVLREVSYGNAIFFDVSDSQAFATEVKKVFRGKYDLSQLSKNGIQIAKQYRKRNFIQKLDAIYLYILGK